MSGRAVDHSFNGPGFESFRELLIFLGPVLKEKKAKKNINWFKMRKETASLILLIKLKRTITTTWL